MSSPNSAASSCEPLLQRSIEALGDDFENSQGRRVEAIRLVEDVLASLAQDERPKAGQILDPLGDPRRARSSAGRPVGELEGRGDGAASRIAEGTTSSTSPIRARLFASSCLPVSIRSRAALSPIEAREGAEFPRHQAGDRAVLRASPASSWVNRWRFGIRRPARAPGRPRALAPSIAATTGIGRPLQPAEQLVPSTAQRFPLFGGVDLPQLLDVSAGDPDAGLPRDDRGRPRAAGISLEPLDDGGELIDDLAESTLTGLPGWSMRITATASRSERYGRGSVGGLSGCHGRDCR